MTIEPEMDGLHATYGPGKDVLGDVGVPGKLLNFFSEVCCLDDFRFSEYRGE